MNDSQDLGANPDGSGGVVVMTWGFLAAAQRFIMLGRYDQPAACGDLWTLCPGRIRQS